MSSSPQEAAWPQISWHCSFVKWPGGKSQLLHEFRNLFPESFRGYFEPFVGGGAVFFYVKSRFKPDAIFMLSDINEELINCYTVVRDNLSPLIELLLVHKKNHSKDYYYSMRDKLNLKQLNNIERAAGLIYLNKTCYNGLYRVNKEGKFNVPVGTYKNPRIFNEETLATASRCLQGVRLELMGFEKIVEFAQKGDFIFLDPPYPPLSKTSSFTSYTPKDFSIRQHEKLAEVFKTLDSRRCFVMLSNSDCALARDLYKEYEKTTTTVRANRMINSVASKRGAINEVVIRNYRNNMGLDAYY